MTFLFTELIPCNQKIFLAKPFVVVILEINFDNKRGLRFL